MDFILSNNYKLFYAKKEFFYTNFGQKLAQKYDLTKNLKFKETLKSRKILNLWSVILILPVLLLLDIQLP